MDGKEKLKLALSDAKAFNQVMMRYDVKALVKIASIEDAKENCQVFPPAVCIYKIHTFGATTFDGVMKYEKEVRSAIALARKRIGYYEKTMSIRFDTEPFFSLEVDSPPGFLLERYGVRSTIPFTSPIGMQFSVDGAKEIIYDLGRNHQTLVAAVSGHGKSKLLKNCLLGLIQSTDPKILRFNLIDMKNDDLAPYKKIPHTDAFAWKAAEATRVIKGIKKELDRRIAIDGFKPDQKILLVIDELAEVDKDMDDTLASIMKLGRSLGVHVLAATQHATAAQVGIKTARAFTHRFVGRTENANSAMWATGASGSGAELLRKHGAFLYCYGGDTTRFQAFNLSDEIEKEIIDGIK